MGLHTHMALCLGFNFTVFCCNHKATSTKNPNYYSLMISLYVSINSVKDFVDTLLIYVSNWLNVRLHLCMKRWL